MLPSRFSSLMRRLSGPSLRAASTLSSGLSAVPAASSSFDANAFTKDFLAQVGDVPAATDPAMSADVLRQLVKSNVLRFKDMVDAPQKFFLAHRLLATLGLGGFGIRFTVQFNLFAGSIVGLAGEEQLGVLDAIQAAGKCGCFLLTEKQAGVLSGLIVETTAEYDPKTQTFDLHTPSDRAAKNWISQGYTAEMGVVIADLRVQGKSLGPHPFLIDLRDASGNLLPGIRVEDMGWKTIANDLDNARVWFDHVALPRSALLSKFCAIDDDGNYVQKGGERMRIEVIGQRLLTGRLCIAQAALVSSLVLHQKTEEYAKQKICNGLAGETTLSKMPQLAAVFDSSYAALNEMVAFSAAVEEQLADCLRHGTIPSPELVDAISVCKIRCIEVAIQTTHALRLECGSYSLMHDTGFELADMLLCCKFAEGDSRILQQKLARDRLKRVQREGLLATALTAFNVFSADSAEARAALSLARTLAPAGRDRDKMAVLMDRHWEDIYNLAELVAEGIVRRTPSSSFPEDIKQRLVAADTAYDLSWKSKLGSMRAKL